jgi:hypothetical protein
VSGECGEWKDEEQKMVPVEVRNWKSRKDVTNVNQVEIDTDRGPSKLEIDHDSRRKDWCQWRPFNIQVATRVRGAPLVK